MPDYRTQVYRIPAGLGREPELARVIQHLGSGPAAERLIDRRLQTDFNAVIVDKRRI